MSIKAVNSLSHYTDWTIGHVHSGALGWNGMITFGAIYFLVPRLWSRERLYSLRMVNWHFWLATTRHRHLRRGDVGVRHHAGPDVARIRRRRASSSTPSPRPSRPCTPTTSSAPVGGVLYLAGGAGHGLQHLDDHPRRISATKRRSLARARPAAGRIGASTWTFLDKHAHHRDATPPCSSLGSLLVVTHRRHRRDRAALLPREHHREGGGDAPLHAARAGRPQHLRPRGLLHLPQPDDPAVPRRGGALRPLQPGGGVDVRPPVPVGLEAHRAGPRPRRRPLLERMACRST